MSGIPSDDLATAAIASVTAPARERGGPTTVPDDQAAARQSKWIWPYVSALCVLTAVVGALSVRSTPTDLTWVALGLVTAVLALDGVRLDLFERFKISPASVPTLALAFLFGPIGPIVSEAAIAIGRVARRTPLKVLTFDFAALSLAGAAAAGVWTALPTEDDGLAIVAGVLAGLVYYAVNTPLLAVVVGLAQGTRPIDNWREQSAWLAPHYVAFGLLAGVFLVAERNLGPSALLIFAVPVGMLWIAEKQYLDRARSSVDELRRQHAELLKANERLHRLLDDNSALVGQIHQSYLSTITSLARTIEAKDPYTGGHTERVAMLAARLGRQLGYKADDLRAVEVGAVIHDIGKIGVPDRILLKEGPLDDDERAEMKRHPEISSYIVGELDLPEIVEQMVRSHHERFDGGGYPDGLVGEQIPLPARILSVADALDAMTSDRPYRKALPAAAALEEIEAQTGNQFCPRVVAALRAVLDQEPQLLPDPPPAVPA